MTIPERVSVAELRAWLVNGIDAGGRFRNNYLDALEMVDVFLSARATAEPWPVEPITRERETVRKGRKR